MASSRPPRTTVRASCGPSGSATGPSAGTESYGADACDASVLGPRLRPVMPQYCVHSADACDASVLGPRLRPVMPQYCVHGSDACDASVLGPRLRPVTPQYWVHG
ncbi:hypothetical protein NDU88_008112 [Pleurodeles waltl]|uniref:Uncharacterized protein n=1 Tax=Pleurodeles waltl TaxID=8319 RepID=A0AAV7U1G6_PLEWA|nr:hypothetical protein NDU88_008112 [Pleurodeles waltl]